MKQHNTRFSSRRDFLRFAVRSSAALTAASIAGTSTFSHAMAAGRAAADAAESDQRIICPRIVNPAFVQPDGTFSVEVRGVASLKQSGWTVMLQNDLRVTWTCQVETATYTDINNNAEKGWRLIVRSPRSIAPELMQLRVSHSKIGTMTANQAVSIVPDLNAPFYALHLTDEHVTRDVQKSLPEGPDREAGYRTAQLVSWGTPVVNTINPRIVINSGDQVSRFTSKGQENALGSKLYDLYFNAKRGYRVPSMMVLGNHDINEHGDPRGQWDDWEQRAGQRYYTIQMGSMTIFGHDYTDEAAKKWTNDAYAASWRDPNVTGRLMVQHFTSWNAVKLPDSMPATLMLVGHLHNTKVLDNEPFPILMSIAAHRYARAGFVSFQRDNQGLWTTQAANDWSSGSFMDLVGPNGVPLVNIKYATPNDGRTSSNRITISNKLGQSFSDGRLRLLMEEGTYSVQGGDVLSSYAYRNQDGQMRRAVVVRVNIGANSTTTVQISSTGSVPAPATDATETEPIAVDANGIPVDLAPVYDETVPAPEDGDDNVDPDPSGQNTSGSNRIWLPLANS